MAKKKLFIGCAILAICLIATDKVAASDWWEVGNFYQIYPRSFQDSDGDGVGDLNGITSRMDHFKELGVTGIWLSPIFQSPMADFGYDISDYTKIHYEYGTMEDFNRLVKRCNELGVKLILDFVPNHTSNEHDWFKQSIAKSGKYADYYVWHPGVEVNGTRQPPSNWISIFRFSAWTWNDERQEYYLHQFLKEQPDLNYRNPDVVADMKAILQLWLDRGVQGFRIDAVPFLFETLPVDGKYVDEKPSYACNDPEGSCSLIHTETADVDETFDMIYQWRDLMDAYQQENGGETRFDYW